MSAPRPITRRSAVASLLGAPGLLGVIGPSALAGRASAQTGPGDVLAIADDAALRAALDSGATAGRVVELAPGHYRATRFDANTAPRVLRSADPANPATFSRLVVEGFDQLAIEDLILSYTYRDGDEIWTRPFALRDGTNAILRRVRVVGDRARNLDASSDGLGFGNGLHFQRLTGIEMTQCHVSVFHRGLLVEGCNDVVIANNEFVGIRMDGMSLSSVRRVWINDNLIHNFERSLDRADHADMIQFWTINNRRQSRDIYIRRNILNAGHGEATQSLFMRNEEVDNGRAGPEMFYRNVVIEENVILNAHLHGITVGESDGLSIRNNTLIQLSTAAGSDPGEGIRIPRINVAGASRNVVIANNVTGDIAGRDSDRPGWQITGNLLIQNQSIMQPNHYSQVFANFAGGDPRALETYRYRADGPAASDVGAARLAP